eukprot:TRINITY_DN649_c0_g2_i1.p1 TRINITY_DN649_c0_g2~~TRINITY_DN649_c0_g2_i1.p1  ORF type:complete len:1064 (+),score=305.53 TRINITY_DN649_c0_g2_i1:140-3331(+)
MGNDQSANQSAKAIMDNLRFIKKVKDERFGEVTLMEDLQSHQLVVVKERNLTSADEFKREAADLTTKKNANNHPGLIRLIAVNSSSQDTFCATFHKITAIFELLDNDLEKEIATRRERDLPFREEELWRLIESVAGALIYLQSQNITHGDLRPFSIFISPEGEYKIANQSLLNAGFSNYVYMMMGNNSAIPYISPKLLSNLQRREVRPIHNPFKSDVFSLGMTVLAAGLLNANEGVYDWGRLAINEMVLRDYLMKFSSYYSEQLTNLICAMVEIDEERRPDFFGLESFIRGGANDMTRRRNSQPQNVGYHQQMRQAPRYGLSPQQQRPAQQNVSYGQNISPIVKQTYPQPQGHQVVSAFQRNPGETHYHGNYEQEQQQPRTQGYVRYQSGQKNVVAAPQQVYSHQGPSQFQPHVQVVHTQAQQHAQHIPQHTTQHVPHISHIQTAQTNQPVTSTTTTTTHYSHYPTQSQQIVTSPAPTYQRQVIQATQPQTTIQQPPPPQHIQNQYAPQAQQPTVQQVQQTPQYSVQQNTQKTYQPVSPMQISQQVMQQMPKQQVTQPVPQPIPQQVSQQTAQTQQSLAQISTRQSQMVSQQPQKPLQQNIVPQPVNPGQQVSNTIQPANPVQNANPAPQQAQAHPTQGQQIQGQKEEMVKINGEEVKKVTMPDGTVKYLKLVRVQQPVKQGGQAATSTQQTTTQPPGQGQANPTIAGRQSMIQTVPQVEAQNRQAVQANQGGMPLAPLDTNAAKTNPAALLDGKTPNARSFIVDPKQYQAAQGVQDAGQAQKVQKQVYRVGPDGTYQLMTNPDATTQENIPATISRIGQDQLAQTQVRGRASLAPINEANSNTTSISNGYSKPLGIPSSNISQNTALTTMLSNQAYNAQLAQIPVEPEQEAANYDQYGEEEGVVTENYNDGSVYIGEKSSGYRHGKGKFYYADGGMYDGDWKYGSMDGFGRLYYVSGKLAYEGEWREDKFCGKGIVFNELPVALNGPFRYENFDLLGDFWYKYEGEFVEDNKEGQGTLFLTNNEIFSGEFRNDAADGCGAFQRMDGTVVNGEWRSNKLVRQF